MISRRIESSVAVKQAILQDKELLGRVEQTINLLTQCFKQGNQVFFCGNGGSAADAQHLAAELSGKFYMDRPGLPASAMHCNTSYLTAVGNDLSFDLIYARLLNSLAKKGDVLVGLSTSGNSKNILNAFETAKKMGIHTVAFTGKAGGLLRDYSDILLNIPSEDTPRIQESHILIGHIICEQVEKNIFE